MMAAITLGAIEVCQSASELAVALNISEIEMPEPVIMGGDMLTQEQKDLARNASIAAFESRKNTLETMGLWRSLILMALAGTASLMFLASLRLRWPDGFPRSASARLIGGAAFAAALFRTLDGAQSLVLTRREAAAALKAYEHAPDFSAAEILAPLPTVLSIGITCAVVGGFLVIGHYFRSERVRDIFVTLDGHEPEPDDE